jgi:hypothetical protein
VRPPFRSCINKNFNGCCFFFRAFLLRGPIRIFVTWHSAAIVDQAHSTNFDRKRPYTYLFFLFPSPLLISALIKRFLVLPPTRAIQDHLRCLAAAAGRTGAQLLGDERSGSAEPPTMKLTSGHPCADHTANHHKYRPAQFFVI